VSLFSQDTFDDKVFSQFEKELGTLTYLKQHVNYTGGISKGKMQG